jgi:zinc protease
MLHHGKSDLRAILIAGIFLFATSVSLAATLPKGVTEVTTVEGITEYRLPNGLKVLLLPDESKPTVAVNITYLVGSRHENYGETGMAHLLEHMLFKGTPNHKDIWTDFNKRGMRPNGTTSLDRTNYFEIFQAGDDNLKWSIELEADRMVNSFIAKKDLDSEMTVVRNEFESGENSPFGVLIKRMQSVVFDWHNYGNSTIGNRSDIENVKIENLQAFYRLYYQPDNAVLMVSGKFDVDKTLNWITTAFSAIPKPTRTLPVLWTVEPTQDGERSFTIHRKGDVQIVGVAYRIPTAINRDTDALDYAASILASSPNGRLHRQLVETGKAVQVAEFDLGKYAPGMQVIAAIVKKGEPLEPVRDELVAAIENFAKTPPTQEEIDRVRREHLNDIEKLLTNNESIGITMSEIIALGDWRLLFQGRDQESDITSAKVAAAAQHYYKRDNRTVGMFIPDDDPQRVDIPAGPTIAEAMAGFKQKTETTTAEVFDPSPANIDKRTQHQTVGGLNVAVLAKKSRGASVSVAINLKWGDEKSLFGKRGVAYLTNNMLEMGTTRYTRAQLSDETDKLKIRGSLFGFDTTKENLAGALKLVAHVMQEANFPENEFVQAKKLAITSIEAQRNEPQSVASTALGQHFNRYPKGDMRYAATPDEMIASINAVTLAEVKAFHKKFYGASKGEISIVGDVDTAETFKMVEQAFGQWKSAAPYTRLSNNYFDVPATRKNIDTPDKENGFYISRMNLEIRDDDPDFAALYVANHVFGGAGLDSRVMGRIRQKDGLSYGGGSNLNVDSFERSATFNVYAIAAPQNLAKVDAAVQEELARAVKDGFTKDEVERAKSGLLQQRTQNRSKDSNLAFGWNSNLDRNRTYAWAQALDDKIRNVTVEQVNAAFRKMIVPAKMSTIIAGDEAKAKAATGK